MSSKTILRGIRLISGAAFAVLFSMPVSGMQITLAWNPNTVQSVAGYTLSYGTASGQYTTSINAGNTTSAIVSNLTPGQTYYLAIAAYGSNDVDGPYSPEIAATMPSLPTFQSQPMSQSVAAGSMTVLSANISSAGPLSYQWMLNGMPIIGATNAQLALTGITDQSAGSYTVVVSNIIGTVTSQAAVLNVTALGASSSSFSVPPADGTYEGLYYQVDTNGDALIAPGTSGWIRFSFFPNGYFSASMVGGYSQSYCFTGRLNSNGDAVASVSNLNVVIHMAAGSPNGQVMGVVSNTSPLNPWVSLLNAVVTTNSCPPTNYNILSPQPPGLLATVAQKWSLSISSNGAVLLSGMLGDRGSVWQSESLGVNGSIPVYTFPYGASGGLLAGWIGVANGVPVGNLTWIRPAGLSILPLGFTTTIGFGGAPLNFTLLP